MQSKTASFLFDLADLIPVVGEIVRAGEASHFMIEGNTPEAKKAMTDCGFDAAIDLATLGMGGVAKFGKIAAEAAGKQAVKTGLCEAFKFYIKRPIGMDVRVAAEEAIKMISTESFKASCEALKTEMTMEKIEAFCVEHFQSRIREGVKTILNHKFDLLWNGGIPTHDDTPDHCFMLIHAATGLPLKKIWTLQKEDNDFYTKLLWIAKHAPAHILCPEQPERKREGKEHTCEWMFGDAGKGWLGFKEVAHLNPLRWSGAIPLEQGIEELAVVQNEGDRPINVKVSSDSGKMKEFANAGEAIEYIQATKFDLREG